MKQTTIDETTIKSKRHVPNHNKFTHYKSSDKIQTAMNQTTTNEITTYQATTSRTTINQTTATQA